MAKSKRVADVATQYGKKHYTITSCRTIMLIYLVIMDPLEDIPQETGAAEREWLSKTHSMAKELQVVILDHVKTWTDSAYGLEKQWQQGLGMYTKEQEGRGTV